MEHDAISRVATDDLLNLPANDPHWHETLTAAHPAYEFESYSTGATRKWAATALRLGAHPWCLVTGDPREFASHLPRQHHEPR